MKIYLFLTNQTTSITACKELAEQLFDSYLKKGEDAKVYEGELKTQGSNFCSWAYNWTLIKDTKVKFL